MGSRAALTTVALETSDAIATITLDRPEKRNALSLAVMRELRRVLEMIGADRTIRAVIVRAHGPAFSAGHDLRELLARSAAEYDEIFSECVALMNAIQAIPQPVIAEVAGVATAAGCQLVATCDLAVAAEGATFATPGVKIGLFCTTPMVALTRSIGRKRALEMLLTGEPVDAATAAAWGLINRVVPAAELSATARALAQLIAAAAEPTVALGKAAFYRQIEADQASAYAIAKDLMCLNALADDAQEGMNAFIERRTPHWSSSPQKADMNLT
jgi:enoyl-CoA hydratase/carnithine racemase